MRTRSIYVIRRIETVGPCEKDYNVIIRGSNTRKTVLIHPVAFSSMKEANKCAKERIQFEKYNLYENAVIADWNDKIQNVYLIYRVSHEVHYIEYFIDEILLADEELD